MTLCNIKKSKIAKVYHNTINDLLTVDVSTAEVLHGSVVTPLSCSGKYNKYFA